MTRARMRRIVLRRARPNDPLAWRAWGRGRQAHPNRWREIQTVTASAGLCIVRRWRVSHKIPDGWEACR